MAIKIDLVQKTYVHMYLKNIYIRLKFLILWESTTSTIDTVSPLRHILLQRLEQLGYRQIYK